MRGSILRLAVFTVFSTLPSNILLQKQESLIQNPVRLRTHSLPDFVTRNEGFSFTFTPEPEVSHTQRPSSLAKHVLRHQFEPTRFAGSSQIFARSKVSRPVLENKRVQNFIRQKIGVLEMRNTLSRHNATFNENETDATNQSNHLYFNKEIQKLRRPENSLLKPILQSSYSVVTKPFELNIPNVPKRRVNRTQYNQEEGNKGKTSFLGYVISTLTQLPVIGNVLRASVDPLYRPIVNQLQPVNETIMQGENDMSNWCFGELGCIKPTYDFFHPLYRPVNLPPYARDKIATMFTIHSRSEQKGYSISAVEIEELEYSPFVPTKPTKIIIHGYLNDRRQTWITEMVRGLLKHGDYNVITIDWSGGAYALYSQATANARVVALEIARLLKWSIENLGHDQSKVHLIGYSLGAHIAGYVGEQIPGIGRITGLDPAEPFFQYMPNSVRLDPSDAAFVDVIHTDTNSFFGLMGHRGFGLQQAVGHVDFYPNGGKEQPGCNQLLATVPMTLMLEGKNIVEGMNAAQTELMNCDHVRSAKLFVDSLRSKCPYLGFGCASYQMYKQGKCFSCGEAGENCAFMGINAALWKPQNKTNVKIFLDTHQAPHFCKFHYILTINFMDPSKSKGTLRGRLKISLINEDGNLKKFDLTALSPLKFPRTGSRTFLLEHYEDLSKSQEALINWTFESDLLDPLSFCVLFCKADLSISSISILSIDTPLVAARVVKLRSMRGEEATRNRAVRGREIIMCHKNGNAVVNIPSESTVKISTSPSCPGHVNNSQTPEFDSLERTTQIPVSRYYNG